MTSASFNLNDPQDWQVTSQGMPLLPIDLDANAVKQRLNEEIRALEENLTLLGKLKTGLVECLEDVLLAMRDIDGRILYFHANLEHDPDVLDGE